MKTGVELIGQERLEQIEKHKYSLEHDYKLNKYSQLSFAASILADEFVHENEGVPRGWDNKIWAKIIRKQYPERLVIAGALIAAEIDRLQMINQTDH